MESAPNTTAALDFLERWSPDGPWVLTAIRPDRKAIQTRTFRERDAAEAWLEEHNGSDNIYFHVNPTTRDLEKKAEREDIAALAWLHVDIDPRVGEDLAQERARALGLLTDNLPEGVPPPTVVIFSGGGYQGFWRLSEPFPIDGDLERAEEAKRWNLQLELLFRADNCHNVDRIMRLPGTVNIPDAKKRRKGRVETTAELVSFTDASYSLDQFTPAPVVASPGEQGFGPTERVEISGNVPRLASVDDLNEWSLSDRVKALVVQGHLRDTEGRKEGDDSRSAWLMDALCQMARAGVPDEVMYSVITDPDFGISQSVLDKGSLTQKYAERQIARAKELAVDPVLAEMNDRFAVVRNIGGRCRVVEEQEDTAFRRTALTMQSFSDFRNAFLNRQVEVGLDARGNPRMTTMGEWWLRHPRRRTFDRLVFDPSRVDVPGSYNLWKGFAYEARPGDCSGFLGHLRDNICRGNEEHYNYLMGWMARLVQRPATPGQVAVVMRGPRGVGKSFFAKHLGRLLGRHFLQVSNSGHLVGNFNAHLRDCLLLFADEAFYAGDRRHESVLKTLITEDLLMIEAKGVDAEAAPNFVHLILASNEDWVVPAGEQERRFFVIDVSDAHQQELDYFAVIDQQMEQGGYSALLHTLMTWDLSGFEVRSVPTTSALQDQKRLSLGPMEDWWYDCLLSGSIGGVGWPRTVAREALQASYIEQARDFNITRRGTATRLGHFLRKICPGIVSRQDSKSRKWLYVLPELDTARSSWERRYGREEWPELAEVDTEEEIPF